MFSWKNFMPHEFSFNRMKEVSSNKGVNAVMTGYPFVESFYNMENKFSSIWKKQDTVKIKLIFAPHHTIEDGNLKLSNFLVISQYIQEFAIKYKDIIQWSFKPHPILKSKLYKHFEWGKEKTDRYYDFWKNEKYTQLDEGEYIDLFLQSDGILHDSGSFIAEYLFVEKPCAYLQLNGEVQRNSINDFGLLALHSYHSINSLEDVNLFITSIIEHKISLKSNHLKFIKDYKLNFFNNISPSDLILNEINNILNRRKLNEQ
jgi:UDP-N-acetylglucosamine 2-epimerase